MNDGCLEEEVVSEDRHLEMIRKRGQRDSLSASLPQEYLIINDCHRDNGHREVAV